MRDKICSLMAAIILVASTACVAQVFRGSVQGLVTDESGAVIPGATVTLLNVNTGLRTIKQTSSSGGYLFNLLTSGTYTISIQATGFTKFVQENIVVQASSGITVNASLQPGTVHQTVTVTSTPSAVQFNTSNQSINVNSTLAQNTPRFDRNPFKLTLLAPEAINTRGEMLPFLSWSANSVDLGGGTNLKNDLVVDGSPVGLGHKYSYPPNMDDVQETTISQNGVDAEFGHSAGGVINITTKSGTNQWHGDAMYLGRYPWLNAISDRTTNSINSTRQNMFGGTLGGPIFKNKLFNFASVEFWRVGQPTNYVTTVPTAAQRLGDFSQTYNIKGGVATIFDPWSTVLNPNTGVFTRTAFPGNKIPTNRMDPLTSKLMSDFWAPNNPGSNITGVNNFEKGYNSQFNYINYSDRVDYDINSRWKVFGRVSGYHTSNISPNITPNNSQLFVPTGTLRTAHQEMGDAIWTVNPTTVVDFHGSYDSVIDAYVSPPMGGSGWAELWPNNPWYESYQKASTNFPIYFPDMNIGGHGFGGGGFYWNQKPTGEAFSANYSHEMGSHYLKAGVEWRREGGLNYVSNTSNFYFNPDISADSPVNPNTLLYGNGFATYLLGALNDQSEMIGGPVPDAMNQYWGMYIQDDWKVTRRFTVNLGLRNEYETAWYGPNMSRGLNLNATVPEMAANPPQMPPQALALVGPNFYGGLTKGLWQFDAPGQGMWNAPALALSPRAGFAFRIDNKSVLRFGYARYVVPTDYNFTAAPFAGFEDVNLLEPPFFGMTGYQTTAPLLEGIPQETFSDPYPSATNPLLPLLGRAYGTNVGRGFTTGLLWYPLNLQKAYNDRIDVNFQRQLPGNIVASVTYFANFGSQHYTKELNAIDPNLEIKYQNALNVKVANPFNGYLNSTLMPGPLFTEPTVTLKSLLVPYPQYGPLFEIGACCAGERYNQLQLQVQRPFSRGFTFLWGYVYTRERLQINDFNDVTYYQNQFQWQDSNQPRHRMNFAASWNLPFGEGQHFLNTSSKALNAVASGWRLSPVLQYISGDFPRFGNMIATGSPCISNPTPGHWFNTSVFQPLPANTYVLRTNPLQYSCLTGPNFWDLDASLEKNFRISEKFNGQLKMTAYNATNHLNRGDPDTGVTSSTFGEALFQGSPGGTFGAQSATEYTAGRQVELGLKLTW